MPPHCHRPIHHKMVRELEPSRATSAPRLCKQVAKQEDCQLEDAYAALHDLVDVGIVTYTLYVGRAPASVVRLNYLGFFLLDDLAEIGVTTRDMSCASTMLYILSGCGACTKLELFRRVRFAKLPRTYTKHQLEAALWLLQRTCKIAVLQSSQGQVFGITKRGRAKLERYEQALG